MEYDFLKLMTMEKKYKIKANANNKKTKSDSNFLDKQ